MTKNNNTELHVYSQQKYSHLANEHWSDRCASRNTGVQNSKKSKQKQYGDEVGRFDGQFTDGLCTAAAIGKLLKIAHV